MSQPSYAINSKPRACVHYRVFSYCVYRINLVCLNCFYAYLVILFTIICSDFTCSYDFDMMFIPCFRNNHMYAFSMFLSIVFQSLQHVSTFGNSIHKRNVRMACFRKFLYKNFFRDHHFFAIT